MPTKDDNVTPIIKPEEEATEQDFMAALKAAQEAAKTAVTNTVSGSSNMTALDSLQGNEFHVELNGEVVSGIFRVDGLTTFKLTDEGFSHPPIVVAKMVQRNANLPFNKWLRETIEASDSGKRPQRNLDVVAVDDGEETRRWTLKGAYIMEVRYDTFDTGSSDMVEEVITIAYEGLYEKWTWSDAQ